MSSSDLGQAGVGISVLLLDRGPEAVSPWGFGGVGQQPPGPVVEEQGQHGSHRGKEAQAQAEAQDSGQLRGLGGLCVGHGGPL